jgi:hypothetical protein
LVRHTWYDFQPRDLDEEKEKRGAGISLQNISSLDYAMITMSNKTAFQLTELNKM